MRPVTDTEVAATAAERFRAQYRHWSPCDRFADGRTKEDVDRIFNTSAHTPEAVSAALNVGWAYPECSACGEHRPVVAEFKEEWSDEAWRICKPCAERVVKMLARFPNADVLVPRAAIARATGEAG